MADDDYSYSFDDDFAEDERLGLSSICEENDKSSASYSFDDDFVSQTTSTSEERQIPASSNNESITVNDEKQTSNDCVVPAVDNTCSESHSYSLDHHDESYIGNISEAKDDNAISDDENFARDCDVKSNNANESQSKEAWFLLPESHKVRNHSNAPAAELTSHTIPLQQIINDEQLEEIEECKEDPKSHEADLAGHSLHWEKHGSTKKKYKPKEAPLPRCATLTTKCKAKSEPDIEQKKKSKIKYSLKRLQVLAQPRKHHMYVQENTHPNIKAKPTKKTTTQTKSQHNNFLDRIEMMERERREKLNYARAEEEYNKKVDLDKMRCPQCGRTQSYSEMITKSMTCTSDSCRRKKVAYQKNRRKTKDFLERLERSNTRRSSKINEVLQERRSSLASQCLEKSKQQQALMRKVSKNGCDFMARMEKDIAARQTKLSRHVELIDESLQKSYTFKPSVNIPEHLIRNRKSGVESLAVPARRYTQTFEERLEEIERKQQKTNVMIKSKKGRAPIETPWQQNKGKAYDEHKMKKAFQKSYM